MRRCDTLRAFSGEEPESNSVLEGSLERGGYHIRVANASGQRSAASMLIERRYSWRGYHTETVAALPHNPNWITLEASTGQQLFGTLTLRIDSEEGLLADTLFGPEINGFRKLERKVCEMSKLAIDPQYGSKRVLASLIHLAYIYGGILHKARDLFIEVNPRHAGFYKRMMGFRQIGDLRTSPRVNAPAVLLHLELCHMDEQINQFGGSESVKGSPRSLYPYFFSQGEVQELVDRICGSAQIAGSVARRECANNRGHTTVFG